MQKHDAFVEAFYAASDVGPAGHEDYVSYYAPDATLIMGPTQYKGHSGIRNFRETGWEKVATRKHICKGTFFNGAKPDKEIMLYGTVDYGFKDGTQKSGVQWAARMLLTHSIMDKEPPKIAFYQVYIVS